MNSASGCEASSNSRNNPVTTNATCSPMSTALSPIRSLARATSSVVVAYLQGELEALLVQVVDHVVLANEVARHIDVALGEGALGLTDLGAGRVAHRHDVLDQALVRGGLVA